MSMALKEIKNRIKAANNIKQITKAMKLIASIKLKKIQKNFFPFKKYLDGIKDIISVLTNNIDFKLEFSNFEIFKNRQSNTKLVVIVSSDKGLCGSYNTNIFNFFEKNYKKEEVKLVTVGRKAFIYFSRRGYDILKNFEKIPDIPSFEFFRELNSFIKQTYEKDKNLGSVEMLYTKFINSMKYQPSIEKILPITNLQFNELESNVNHFIFEPSIKDISNYVFELYIDSLIYKLIVESKLSEFSARFSAMNIATDNAEKLIKELRLIFFKQRQESITKELLEISAGVEALK